MMRIYKYPVPAQEDFHVWLPPTARVLAVQTQHGKPYIWVMLDPSMATESRNFKTFPTGLVEFDSANLRYIGTFQVENETLVFHLFEEMQSIASV